MMADDIKRAEMLLIGEKLGPLSYDKDLVAWVARRARELFGPTPEEQAVIEAASVAQEMIEQDGRTALTQLRQLFDAVRAYRASREPKPRSVFYAEGFVVYESVGGGKLDKGFATCGNHEDAERIARRLNEADK